MTYILHMSKTWSSKNLNELMRDCNKYPSARPDTTNGFEDRCYQHKALRETFHTGSIG